METLTRLVSESLARHGFDRPLDYRRLQWSRWFRCESHHSLLFVPSKPGVFALAEEVMSLGKSHAEGARHKATATEAGQGLADVEERRLSAASETGKNGALAPVVPEAQSPNPEAQVPEARRMLAVTQFFEADDMAFVLDSMLARAHVMHSRLESGRYFVRYVEIQDETQRRSICNALNQWIVSSAEKATGIGSHFASSLELTSEVNVGRAPTRANAESGTISNAAANHDTKKEPLLEAVTASTVQRSPLFPSGF